MIRMRCASAAGSRVLLATAVGALIGLAQCGVAAAHDRGHGHNDVGRHQPTNHHHRGGHHGRGAGALFVSPSGSSSGSDRSCHTAGYATIQSAVNAATPDAKVVVCPGAYTEDVIVSTPLRLRGIHATIHGSPTTNGNCDQLGAGGPGSAPCLAALTIKSSDVRVSGFTITGAIGEGILATGSLAGGSISDVSITHNLVTGNDTGGYPGAAASGYPQCAAVGGVPGDCGEGIHLMGVANSRVSHNESTANTGGILVTDEFGPSHDNVIAHNIVTRNQYDCGITVPGHNPNAVDAAGVPQPSVAGVYDNVIAHNRITDNGLAGAGAGVLFANAGAGTASYDNLVVGNYIAGNEQSGVTMHAHTLAPGGVQDLDGNRIIHNVIGTNNLGSPEAGPGDPLDGPPVTDPDTTGILVFSGTTPVQVTIAHNRVFADQYGVWLGVGTNVTATLRHNRFEGVTTPVFTPQQ